jgi:aminoglycoside phosphotransferase (APT) family kinase protein
MLGARVRGRRRLAEARAFAERILASDADTRAACGPRPVVARAELTSTDLAVVIVAPEGQPPCAVLKLPMTDRAVDGLVRESRTLDALHADERLGDWRRLLPVVRASGTLNGRPYRVDAPLRGRVLLERLADRASRRLLLTSAAETIHVLHRATASPMEVDERLVEHWVDGPANELLAGGAARGLESALRAMRDELHDSLIGRTVLAGSIHGDYWLGNVLYAADEVRPLGILDWDAAGAPELPVIDVLHLLLYTRTLLGRRDFGEVISGAIRIGAWSDEERGLLDRFGTWSHRGSLSERALLLLCWLRHAAHHVGQRDDPDSPGYLRWQSRNVRPVLTAL